MNLEDTSDSDCSSTKNILPNGETASDVIPIYRRQYGCCTTPNESGDSGHSNDVAGWKLLGFLSHSTGACSWRLSRVFEAAMRTWTFIETRLNMRCFSHGRVGIADEGPMRVGASGHYLLRVCVLGRQDNSLGFSAAKGSARFGTALKTLTTGIRKSRAEASRPFD